MVADNLFILNIQFQKIRSKDIAASRTMMEMYIQAVFSISERNLSEYNFTYPSVITVLKNIGLITSLATAHLQQPLSEALPKLQRLVKDNVYVRFLSHSLWCCAYINAFRYIPILNRTVIGRSFKNDKVAPERSTDHKCMRGPLKRFSEGGQPCYNTINSILS